ncbi:RNA polymerase recycling motor HelD [Hathewaya limosa]|uniref:DNA helicase-2/ATP-dependent DNA helicase PcrA n=1 Tax=Hathewaya limosa TaxID=1536 RepID=A0ABU0JV12_HATLI|nr:RNA polymerase recycling motor HelD [Hathewaya limosa]MDQ0480947.1 DNA helicase-2/ATP-dependent DNA helicase PcrA [Hathewaya limosa]
MPAFEHPDYKTECKRLDTTLNYLRNFDKIISKQKNRIDEAVEYSTSHYNSDNAEQFNELVINEVLQVSMKARLKNISRSLSKPYFARVDFTEKGLDKMGKYYIGKMSLLHEKTGEFLIVDWRSPVANLYYEGRLGEASYICPDGNIHGDISLKRQYTIENACLKEIFDIDITTNDDFLQAALGSNKDNRLKDIVSTIQSEQNQVIRADMWKPLIVQGAAGGGKTTIALHRIAYLMYNYEKTLKPENFMIIAPNRFFLSYISEVLPELGVENVTQTTFEDFAFNVIGKNLGKKLKLKSPHEKLSTIIENYSDKKSKENNNIIEASCFKSSLEFKELLNKYLKYIEYHYIPKEDFKIHDFVLFTYKEIQKLFIKDYSYLPFSKRINEIKKSMINRVKYQRDKILDRVDNEYECKLDKVRASMGDCPERRTQIIEIIDERDNLLLNIKKGLKTVIKDYTSKIPKRSVWKYYENFLINLSKLNTDESKFKLIDYIKHYSLENLMNSTIEVEDLSPLMYISISLYGISEKLDLRHIIIDEAQDFSLFQLYVLKKIVNNSSFTILGDLCQGIYSYRGIHDWNDVSKYIFTDENSSQLCLEQSYRTTIEIMNTASEVIGGLNDPRLPKAKPVIRHGNEVKVFEKDSLKDIAKDIHDKIEEMLQSEYKSMAIICKTLDECMKLKSLLKEKKNVSVITGKEKDYPGGIVLIPCYLAKGLEFDVVIIANASKDMYTESELDVKLLYVAMTRPLHELYIYSLGEKTKILPI